MTRFKTTALKAYTVLEPKEPERKLASWLHGRMLELGVDVSIGSVHNWLSGRVPNVPERAWGALLTIEGEAVLHLEGLLKDMGQR